jgi:Ras-related protein Rab-5C
MCWLIVDPRG